MDRLSLDPPGVTHWLSQLDAAGGSTDPGDAAEAAGLGQAGEAAGNRA